MAKTRPVLYHSALSVDCWRVRWALSRAGYDVELRDVLMSNKHRDELAELCEGAVIVPALVLPTSVIADSEAILRFIKLRTGG